MTDQYQRDLTELRARALAPQLGPELAHWAAEQTERIRELRQEADRLEQEVSGAFAGARALMGTRT